MSKIKQQVEIRGEMQTISREITSADILREISTLQTEVKLIKETIKETIKQANELSISKFQKFIYIIIVLELINIYVHLYH